MGGRGDGGRGRDVPATHPWSTSRVTAFAHLPSTEKWLYTASAAPPASRMLRHHGNREINFGLALAGFGDHEGNSSSSAFHHFNNRSLCRPIRKGAAIPDASKTPPVNHVELPTFSKKVDPVPHFHAAHTAKPSRSRIAITMAAARRFVERTSLAFPSC